MLKGKFNKKLTEGVNSIAKKMVKRNADSACIWLSYQPVFPREAEKLKKSENI